MFLSIADQISVALLKKRFSAKTQQTSILHFILFQNIKKTVYVFLKNLLNKLTDKLRKL